MIKLNRGTASSLADSSLNLRSNLKTLQQTRERDFVFWLLIIFALLALTEAVLILGFSLMGRSAVVSLGLDIGPLPSVVDYIPADVLSAASFAQPSMQIVDYGSTPDISELLIAGGLGLIALFLLLLARRRVIHNHSLYADRGCPRCNEFELVRIDRRVSDRALSAAGIPIYRYACRNCTWRGRRLGLFDNETHFHMAREAETPVPWFDPWQASEAPALIAETPDTEKEPLTQNLVSPDNEYADDGLVKTLAVATDAVHQNEAVHNSAIAESESAPATNKVELVEETSPAPENVKANTEMPYPFGREPNIYPDHPAVSGNITFPDSMVMPPELVVESLKEVTEKSPIELAPEEFERLVLNSPPPKKQ